MANELLVVSDSKTKTPSNGETSSVRLKPLKDGKFNGGSFVLEKNLSILLPNFTIAEVTVDANGEVDWQFAKDNATFVLEFGPAHTLTGKTRQARFVSITCGNPHPDYDKQALTTIIGMPAQTSDSITGNKAADYLRDSKAASYFYTNEGKNVLAVMTRSQLLNNRNSLRADIYGAIKARSPMYFASVNISRLKEEEEKKQSSNTREGVVFQTDNEEIAYIQMLTFAASAAADCSKASVLANPSTDYPNTTQIGKFLQALFYGIEQSWIQALSPSERAAEEARRKAAGMAKNPPDEPAPDILVNASLSDLEIARARARADNQIVFISGSSGVNLFTNPAGDTTNVYTILDIMRDEQAAYIFEGAVVNVTTENASTATGDSQCERVLGKLNAAELWGLIKTVADQIEYNYKRLEKLQLIMNRTNNSSEFKWASLWAGIPRLDMSFSGGGDTLDRIGNAASEAAGTTGKYAREAGSQLLNSAQDMQEQAWKDIKGVSTFATGMLVGDFSDLFENIKNNAKNLKEALKNLTPEDISVCNTINTVAKLANSPQLVSSSIDKMKNRAIAQSQALQKHALEAKTITESQERLAPVKEVLMKVVAAKTKLGA